MAISSKNVFEKFQQNKPHPHFHQNPQDPNVDITKLTDSDLYKRFKSTEQELKTVLESRGNASIILQEHSSFSNPKRRMAEVLMQVMSRSSMLHMIQHKQIDERFWTLIKKEIKRGEQELQRSKGSMKQDFDKMLMKNKDTLGSLIKQAWGTFDPLKEPHLPDATARKMLGRLLVAVAETLKLKGKQDKSVLKDVKDFLNRSLKIYSFSGRTHELLGCKF